MLFRSEYDRYYLDRRGQRPLPIVRVTLTDADQTRYYIDPRTGRLAGVYSDRNWVTRWLYHGLHSLDFPWLYAHRPLWDIVVITFMGGGTLLGVTAGYVRGITGAAIMRFTDLMMAFPPLLLAIALAAILKPGLGIIIVVIALVNWVQVARVVYTETTGLAERDFIEAARALGAEIGRAHV